MRKLILTLMLLSSGTAWAQLGPAPGLSSSMLGQPNGPAQLDSAGTAGSLIANGRSLAARAQDVINVKDAPYGAKGDTIPAPGSCTIAAGSSALNCSSATFTPADVGKAALLHGSGPAGIAQRGKITGYVDSHDVTCRLRHRWPRRGSAPGRRCPPRSSPARAPTPRATF